MAPLASSVLDTGCAPTTRTCGATPKLNWRGPVHNLVLKNGWTATCGMQRRIHEPLRCWQQPLTLQDAWLPSVLKPGLQPNSALHGFHGSHCPCQRFSEVTTTQRPDMRPFSDRIQSCQQRRPSGLLRALLPQTLQLGHGQAKDSKLRAPKSCRHSACLIGQNNVEFEAGVAHPACAIEQLGRDGRHGRSARNYLPLAVLVAEFWVSGANKT